MAEQLPLVPTIKSTFRLPGELYRRFKIRAIQENRAIADVLIDAVELSTFPERKQATMKGQTQLAFDGFRVSVEPFKSCLLKWIGNKQRFAHDLAFPISQLRESHGQILVPARERETPPVTIAPITSYTLLKVVGGQVVYELGENSLVGIHAALSAICPDLC